MKLEACDLTYAYQKGRAPVINHLSFSCSSTERLAITAPSGYGKTTLCQLLSGYLRPDSGQVLLNGQLLPLKGYCPVQMIWQHPEKTVNPRRKMRDVLAEGDNIEPRIITELGIEPDWLNRYPAEISGGELQRFCIARALGAQTKFILADEISTMLDPITQSQIWSFLLREVTVRSIGLVLVSHSSSLLDYVATRKLDLTRESV